MARERTRPGCGRLTEQPMASAPAPFVAALEAAAAAPAPGLLGDLRDRGRDSLSALGLPSRRQEEWRFTGLKALQDSTFEPPEPVPPRFDANPWRIEGSHLLVFVDGIFAPDISDQLELPDGVVVSNLVLAASADSESVSKHLGSLAPLEEHPFAALNSAVLRNGALIEVPTGVEVARPIQIIFVSGSEGRPTLAAPRILIVAGAGSRLTVVENHIGDGGASLSCPVAEIVLDEKAALNHMVVQEEDPEAHHLGTRQVVLAAGSRYEAQSVSLGGALARTDIGVVLDGEGAEASLDGLYISDGRQQAETHLTVRHAAPNCESHQLYKGILGGKARTVFTGRIVVDQDSQKTNANQANRNLILSQDAVAHSNPQLEIFADDVRCTHGSTVGKLDEEAVFYLRSRGISRDRARGLLTLAFAGEVLDRIPIVDLHDRVKALVDARLERIEEERKRL